MVSASTWKGETSKFVVYSSHVFVHSDSSTFTSFSRIHKYASCSNECFILALIYIDRLIQRNNFLLTELNVHRVVITAVLLAAKFFDDAYYNNAYYAKVGGVLVSEMNSLEVEFLFRINFSLRVLPDVFEKYNSELIGHAKAMGLRCPPHCSAEDLYHGVYAKPSLPQQQVSSGTMYADASAASQPNDVISNHPVQVANYSVTQAVPQAPVYQHHLQQQPQVVSQFNGIVPTHQLMQNPPHITPSPPPQPPIMHGAPVAYNYDLSGATSYDPNVVNNQQVHQSAQHHQFVSTSSTDKAFEFQQQQVLSGSGVDPSNAHYEESNNQWSSMSQDEHNFNSCYQDDSHLGLTLASSAEWVPQYANVYNYSNVPVFPNLPETTTPSSTTFSSNSSPGALHSSSYGTQHFVSSSGSDHPLRNDAQYVNNYPQVES